METAEFETKIEPGLLPVFKLYLWVRIGLMIILSIVTLVLTDFVISFNFFPYVGVFITDAAFLIVFLVIDRPKIILGNAYLPIALGVVSITTILETQYLFENAIQQDLAIWLLFVTLSIPLIITAWQWDLQRVYIFSFGTAVFEFFLIYADLPQSQWDLMTTFSVILIRTAMFILMGYIVTLLVDEQRKQRNRIEEANKLLLRYSHRIRNMAVIQERSRMTRELHDTLAHSLSGLVVQLDALAVEHEQENLEHQERINDILEYARKGLVDTRRAMQDLKSSELEDLGLKYTLEKYIEDLKRMSDIQIEFKWHIQHTQLIDIYEHSLFRIIQEAMKNAVVHSSCSKIWLTVAEENGRIAIQIKDNGKGFDLSKPDIEGFGLESMAERAEHIHAAYEIISVPDKGTTITAELRLEDDQSIDM